ncbi:hypothetical protein DFH28DRAFT_917114 [Melampsora americana]|nr:hypothetical protein DFH28DRAFT_917114 [Melampsora americana]
MFGRSRGTRSRYSVEGFNGFLALLHYTGRFPVAVFNIRNLIIAGVTKGQANQIIGYFDHHQEESHGLSRVVQLRIKHLGAARAKVYNPHSRDVRQWRRVNLNKLHGGNIVRNETDQHNCLQITGMENFITVVDLASRYPDYNQRCKRMVIRGVEQNDFEEIVTFFVDLKAGGECFPEVNHLVNVSEA